MPQRAVQAVLLTAEDRAVIRNAAEREGRLLAGHVLAHRKVIETLITDAKLPAGEWKAAAFFLVGCVPPEDVRRLYWGSHNYHDSLAVTTFGDHAAVPRVGLPDLFWGMTLAAPDPVQARARRAVAGLVRREATRVMLALRDGPKDLAGLAAAAGVKQAPLKDTLAFLSSLDYVAESAGRYEARITVLDERDRGMVRQLRQLGRQATSLTPSTGCGTTSSASRTANWWPPACSPTRTILDDASRGSCRLSTGSTSSRDGSDGKEQGADAACLAGGARRA